MMALIDFAAHRDTSTDGYSLDEGVCDDNRNVSMWTCGMMLERLHLALTGLVHETRLLFEAFDALNVNLQGIVVD
jgi:hypothetical protein